MFLVTSYLVLSLIGTFSMALFLKSTSAYRTALHTQNRIIAFHQAESGIDLAYATLKNNLAYTGQSYAALGSSGGYQAQIDIPDPTKPNMRRIMVAGFAPSNAAGSYAFERRQVVAYVNFSPQSRFNFALFSNTSIQMSGNAGTDSYDSRNGPYYPQTAGSDGDVGTNTIGGHMVMLSGNAQIKGDMMVGPGGNPTNVITMSGHAVIQGSRTAAAAPKVLDPVSVPTGLVDQGSLSVSGNNTVTLGGGSYWYSSLSITGNGKVNFTGPATVYVTGNVSISGNGFGTSQDLPPNLTIQVAGARNVSLTGNGNFYGAIYAPASDISISGNGSLFGAIIGNTLQDSGNGKIHYDQALNTAGVTGSGSGTFLA